MVDSFEFKDGEKHFTCSAASSPATPGTVWWWMSVSGESQRYAAFSRSPGDTAASVKPRILAYYAQLLVDRARPPEFRSAWGRGRPAKKAEGDEEATTV